MRTDNNAMLTKVHERKCPKAEMVIDKQMNRSVQETLEQIIAKEVYKSYEIFIKKLSTDGGNYFGDLYEIDVKGTTAKGFKEINLFVKQAIKMNPTESVLNVNSIYQNELLVYTELSKVYSNLQDEAGIPSSERFKMVNSYNESNEDAIILENLSKKGFEVRNRMDVVSLSFAIASIKEIAKFHGLSFVLEHKESDYCYNKLKKLQSPIQVNDSMKELVKMLSNDIVKYFDCDIQKKLRNFSDKICDKLPKYFQGKTGSVKCLCHSDFRINNILFKEKGSESAEAILIDYQLIFWGSPVFDLLYFFYICTDREFRKNHMTYLKNIYHDTLRNYLNYFKIDVDKIYPKNIFLDDFEDHLEVGLLVAFYGLPFCFTREEEVPDFKDNVTDMKIKLHDSFVERFEGIVDDYLEWGII
ncbi:uncharacterized protein LOC116779609 [Danaus plexippus]|uniref:uncharacterized protein LOC116779609 n=1 Tax=Danaus plexippus TaxID=13037 RepID=UPI002AB13F6F|nr:uncharacterized protein LOC116779609 [Danaus plexippus]